MSQILQLGLIGAETTLSEVGRVFASFGNTGRTVDGRSANDTLHTDFIARKRQYSITYTEPTETLKDQITAFYDLQGSNAAFLNFIYTDSNDSKVATLCKMEAPVFGRVIPKGDFYYAAVSIDLEEV